MSALLPKQRSTGAKPRLLHALGTSFGDLRRHLPGEIAFGFAPADEGDEVAQSSLANLYLPALRLLLTVRFGGFRFSSSAVTTCLPFAQHSRCALVPLSSDRPVRAEDVSDIVSPQASDVRLRTIMYENDMRQSPSLPEFCRLPWLPPR